MTKLHILCVSNLYGGRARGGSELAATRLNKSLTERGHQLTVLTLAPDEDSSHVEDGIRVVQKKLRNLYWPFDSHRHNILKKAAWHLVNMFNPWMGRQVRQVLDSQNFDVAITHNIDGFSPSVWRELKRKGIPFIHVVHDVGLVCPRRTMYRTNKNCQSVCKKCEILTATERFQLRNASSVVFASTALRSRINLLIPNKEKQNQRVIHSPLPVGNTHVIPRQDDSDQLRLGFIGRIEQVKGIELLLATLDSMGEGRPKLVVAGRAEPSYQKALIEKFPWANDSFIGYQPFESVCEQIDVLVVPSLIFEALGMGPVQAARQGVPSLVARIGGLPETILPDHTGWMFEPGNQESLATEISKLQKSRSAVQNASRACRRFDWDSAERRKIDRFEETLEQLVSSES